MKAIARLLEIMKTLRDPEKGCSWDRKQTIDSILPHTIEETYELAETIETGDARGLCDELGDLLFHVVFYAQMASEQGEFDFTAVVENISEKLVRRHPHVFAGVKYASAEEQAAAWEKIKQEERQKQGKAEKTGHLAAVSQALPALIRAGRLQKRAAIVGFDWDDTGAVIDKIEEELAELKHEIRTGGDAAKIEEELGDLLFAVVNGARHLQVDPERALRQTNRKFEYRFAYIEKTLSGQGKSLEKTTLEEMEVLWQEAKTKNRTG